MRRSVDRFCRDCGYEFSRDSTGECPMCARLEQLRTEFSVPRPSELVGRQTRPEQPFEVNDRVPSVEGPATAAEYGVVFAAYRARAALGNGQSGRPATTLVRTPAQPQPATEVPGEALAESQAPPQKPPSRGKNRRATRAPTAAVTGESQAPAREKSIGQPARPVPTPGPIWPTPILIRLRAPAQPADATIDTPTAALSVESLAPTPKSGALRDGPTPMLPPTRESAWKWSPAATENSATGEDKTPRMAPNADRISRGRTVLHRAASTGRWAVSQTPFWVVIMSVLIGALVPLLLTQ
jgi:hypothetical protein